MKMMMWKPILTDQQKGAACRKVYEIAQVIAAKDFRKNSCGLMRGNVGIALFFYYYWQWSGQEDYYEKASERLLERMDKITVPLTYTTTPQTIHSSLYDGVTGVGWAINHLMVHDMIEGEIEDSMGTIEPWLYRRMIDDLQQGKLGLLTGATGIGLYAASRDNRVAKEYLRRFVTDFFTMTFADQRVTEDFSISTGVSGLYLLLLKIREKHDDFEGLDSLLTFFEQQIQARIEQILLQKGEPREYELGWRKQKVGLLISALRSRNIAAELCDGLKAALLTEVSADYWKLKFYKSGLAGGVFSVGHCCNRIYHFTQDERFKELVRMLFGVGLEQASFSDPNCGYKMWLTSENGFYGLHTGLLEGLSGVGLALMAAVSDQQPYWGAYLLIS